MKKEHLFILIAGLLLLGYLLDAVVNPLTISLPTPYHYFASQNLTIYPFTTVSIALKAIAILLSPLLILSFFDEIKSFPKALITLVLSALLQLYAVQDIATQSATVPLEWSLGLTLGGLLLLLPTFIFSLRGIAEHMHAKLFGAQHPQPSIPSSPTKLKRLDQED